MGSAQEIVAKALWADGNTRIGHRPWGQVRMHYMSEAGHALAALRANGYSVDRFDLIHDSYVLMALVNAGADTYVRQDDPRACRARS